MTRRQALMTLAAAQKTRRPNFLFILTDDDPVSALSCYGNTILRTPNMDRLAEEGFRFANCFVTNSLCAPSRASILTGTYSHSNGVRGNSEIIPEPLRPDIPMLPQLLHQAGYRTGIAGKWHLDNQPSGFDYSCVLPGQGLYNDPVFIESDRKRTIRGYVSDIITDLALDFLQKNAPQPFCLFYHHKGPHRPFTPAARHARMFDDIRLPHPPAFDDDYSTRRIAQQAEDMRFDISLAGDYDDLPRSLSAPQRKEWLFQRFVKDHWRTTYGVDENIGRVLAWLDRSGLASDTFVIYTSDNGFYLGEHGWYDKRFMYEPSLRVPLLIRYPRLAARRKVEERMVLNIDLAPTILDFAGVPIPKTMQGRSLRPLLEGRATEWRRSIYYTYYENSWADRLKRGEDPRKPAEKYLTAHRVPPHRGVRTSRHKLIEYYGEGDYWELFDLEKDPHELRNLHGDRAYDQFVAELKTELLRLRREYKDLA